MQTERPVVDGVKRPNRSLADFVAPKAGPDAEPDWIGMFAVTAGLGAAGARAAVHRRARRLLGHPASRRWLTAWPRPLPSALHQRVRTEFWGYAAG
jgi:5-methyltetrahydrofolate--homocysteine methyltransferase